MRMSPEARALWVRAKRPTIRVALGTALMVPAAALMAGGRMDVMTPTATAPVAGTVATSEQWSEPVLEHERSLVVESFAREFDIPVGLAEDIHTAALEADIAPRVAFGLVKAESSFRPKIVSPVGAVGLTQLLPSTARWLVPGTTRKDLMQPETNLKVGFKYLHHLIESFDGNEMLALTAYNRGPGTVSKLLKRGADPDNGYAEKVLTGKSTKHVALMNAKFGSSKSAKASKSKVSKSKPKVVAVKSKSSVRRRS
jgi:hypothetical protein